jgi:hypothetical protein
VIVVLFALAATCMLGCTCALTWLGVVAKRAEYEAV